MGGDVVLYLVIVLPGGKSKSDNHIYLELPGFKRSDFDTVVKELKPVFDKLYKTDVTVYAHD